MLTLEEINKLLRRNKERHNINLNDKIISYNILINFDKKNKLNKTICSV